MQAFRQRMPQETEVVQKTIPFSLMGRRGLIVT